MNTQPQEQIKSRPGWYLEKISAGLIGGMVIKFGAGGGYQNNPAGWHLSKHYEIERLADQLVAATQTSNIIPGGKKSPFTVIEGSKGQQDLNG